MPVFGVIGIIIGITNLIAGAIVYFVNSSSVIHRRWMLFAFSVSIWGFGSYLISITSSYFQALLFWRLTLIGVSIIPFSYLWFIQSFTKKENEVVQKLSIFACCLFCILAISPYFVPGVHLMFDSFYFNDKSQIHFIFIICFVATILYSFNLLWQTYKENRHTKLGKQILLLLVASGIGTAGGSTSFLPTYGIMIYPYLNASIILFPLIIGYTINKHNLFNVRFIAIEIVIALLWVITYVKILAVRSLNELLTNSIIFIISVIFGILLIRSTLHDLTQRDRIEQLSAELHKAYDYIKNLNRTLPS